jgi:ABC-type oligopeptide transport system substrate-binding subunit
MNKILLVTAVALVFASAVIMIGSGSIQSAHACSGSGTAAQNANPTTPSNLNAQIPSQPTSAALVAGLTA